MQIVVGGLLAPDGQAAIDRAATEAAGHPGSVLHLVGYTSEPADDEPASRYRDDRARSEALMRELGERLLERYGVNCRVHVPVASRKPSEAILSVAREVDADLIVIAVRRRSPVGKLVLGSNAQDVLLQAGCPVLAVHPSYP